MISWRRSSAFSASSRLFDLNGETNRVRKKHNRVIIAGDVRRFGHVINKDGVLGTHNHLFAGSDGGGARWATVCSLIATAKLNNVEPFAYLKDVLERMSSGHPMSRLDDLLPWNWAPANAKS